MKKNKINKHPATDWLEVTWSTPIGPMTGRLTGHGLSRLSFPPEAGQQCGGGEPAVQIVAERLGPGLAAASEPMREVVRKVNRFLEKYFSGREGELGDAAAADQPAHDWSAASDFDRRVWAAAQRIAPGQTVTYGQLAAAIGQPRAARAVGGALGRNPNVLLTPCHRVIAAAAGARRLGGFTGGLALKRFLLALEAQRYQAPEKVAVGR